MKRREKEKEKTTSCKNTIYAAGVVAAAIRHTFFVAILQLKSMLPTCVTDNTREANDLIYCCIHYDSSDDDDTVDEDPSFS
jgi:hypothetical protein